ncbi:toll/interleukin-1 receptor domain-containing protein [Prosthecobacter sp.]|uniref:toll/interleukin-1 receptor domain-containing protein n=1 Tax=Prosthecobacter sp. TaxID=1965333 RepID=UPI0037852CE3
MSQPYDVFVSYSRNDKARVVPWVEDLKRGGIKVFFDSESLLGGVKWQHEIVEAIRTARIVILFISRASAASEFVPKELALSVDMKKYILPVLLEETEIGGQMAFCIAGLQRVVAYEQDDPGKILRDIQASLQHVGIEWKTSSRNLSGILRAFREVSLDDGEGNVRVLRKPENEPEPETIPDQQAEVSSENSEPAGRWLRRWVALMTVAGAVGVFLWMDGGSWFEPKPIPMQPIKAVPVETLEQEAESVVKNYYLNANKDSNTETSFMADEVDYLGHLGATKAEVKAAIETNARQWLVQKTELLKAPVARVIEAGKLIECEVPLRCTRENAVVKNISTYTARLRLQMIKSELKIIAVSEVPGTQKTELLQFQAEGQKKKVLDFITRAVRSGSSDSGMTPDDIAAMYVEKPDYFGRAATHVEIAKETGRLIELWEMRNYKVLEGPTVIDGLGTPDVEVRVGLEYHVSSPSRGKTSQGWVRSSYLVHFSSEGFPLIQKHAEIERGQ